MLEKKEKELKHQIVKTPLSFDCCLASLDPKKEKDHKLLKWYHQTILQHVMVGNRECIGMNFNLNELGAICIRVRLPFHFPSE